MEDITFKRKVLSIASHAAIFLSATLVSFAVPLTIYFISEDDVVRQNAKESLNFHLNVWLYGAIFGVLTIILIGWPLLFALGIVSWIMPILAIVKLLGNPDQVHKYPFIFRLL